MYSEEQLVRIARRENNTKRSYLVVNRLQGKHVPVSPKAAFQMFSELAALVKKAYDGEKLLLVGFAETATAIGAALAAELDTLYMQTTREEVPGAEYLYFSESHSHAMEQKLVKDDIDRMIDKIDRIVFVEDEVTTGNTILKIITILEERYPGRTAFAVASLLNGMDEEALNCYREKNIPVHYLVKTDHSTYGEIAGKYRGDGSYWKADKPEERDFCRAGAGGSKRQDFRRETEYKPGAEGLQQENVYGSENTAHEKFREMRVYGWMNARRCVEAGKYRTACEKLWETIKKSERFVDNRRILVLGTEEFMYPALYIAKKLEERCKKGSEMYGECEEECRDSERSGWDASLADKGEDCLVRFHATTRSPITVSSEEDYPLHVRYELKSFYDKERQTFIYDLDKYDLVLILTDAAGNRKAGVNTLVNALRSCGNEKILLVRWCGV